MKEVKAILQPYVLDEVCDALAGIEGLPGLTISHVEGFGVNIPVDERSTPDRERHGFAARRKLEVVLPDALVPAVIEAIRRVACTGKPGDGKIFVSEVVDAVKISTGERGEAAV